MNELHAKIHGWVGRGVKAAVVNDSGNLIFTMTDGNVLDLGNVAGPVELTENEETAKTTTKDRVLVLNTDYGECYYEKRVGERYGTLPRNDGSYIAPSPDQSVAPPSNAPKRYLLGLINDWVGRTKIKHGYNTLFDEDMSDADPDDPDSKYELDCSSFVCAVLNGITYANSRYANGRDSENIPADYIGDNTFPDSIIIRNPNRPVRKKALTASELPQYYAKKKRLFKLGTDIRTELNRLEFGDILFFHNPSKTNVYYGIDHVAFVLGTLMPNDIDDKGYVIVAQDTSSAGYSQEGTSTRISILPVTDANLSDNDHPIGTYYSLFARPDYSGVPELEPDDKSVFMIPGLWIDGINDGTKGYLHLAAYRNYSSAQVNFIKVKPGQTVRYIGPTEDEDGKYFLSRVFFYNKDFNPMSSTGSTQILLTEGTATACEIPEGCEYIRMHFAYLYEVGKKMTLKQSLKFRYKISDPVELYSEVVSVSGNHSISADDFGKTICTTYNQASAITLPQDVGENAPLGTEIAIARYGSGERDVTLETDSSIFYVTGAATACKKVRVSELNGMITMKKVSTASGGGRWLITGNVEVVS